MSTRHKIALTVNGERYEREVDARTRLADFLREDLALTGTHVSCEHGICGVCTVALDGKPALSCLTLAVQAHGSRVSTIEGLAGGSGLGILQQAFLDKHALQCGFCTPGFLMALTCLFERDPQAPDDAIREVIDGILCRCTGYQHIFDAAVAAREMLRERNS